MKRSAPTSLRRLAHLRQRDRFVAQADVLFDRAGEDERILQHETDVPPHALLPRLRDVHAIEQDAPLLDVVEAQEQVDQAGLAGARRPDERHPLARLDREDARP